MSRTDRRPWKLYHRRELVATLAFAEDVAVLLAANGSRELRVKRDGRTVFGDRPGDLDLACESYDEAAHEMFGRHHEGRSADR